MGRFRFVLVVACVLLAAACSSGSSADAQPYIDAVAAELTSEGGPTEEDAICIAEAVVDAFGAGTLADADVTPDQFVDAEEFDALGLDVDQGELQDDLESSLADCELGDSFAELLLSEFAIEISEDDRRCIESALDDNAQMISSLAAVIADSAADQVELETAFFSSLADCPEVLGKLYLQAVVAGLIEGGEGPTEEDAKCIGSAVVDAIGIGTFLEAEITPEAFAESQDIADLDLGLDTTQLQADLKVSLGDCELGDSFVDVLFSQFPVEPSESDRACIADALDDSEELTASLAAGFAGTESDTRNLETALAGSFASCPEVLGGLIADSIQDAGVDVDDAARQCIIDQVADGGAAFVEAVVDGGAASQQLGLDIQQACLPDAAG